MKTLSRSILPLLPLFLVFSLSLAQSDFQSMSTRLQQTPPTPMSTGHKLTTTRLSGDNNIGDIWSIQNGQREGVPSSVDIVPQEAAIDPATYSLGPNDIVTIGIWDEVSLSIPLRVTPDGTIILNPAGPIALAGLTVCEAEKEVRHVLKSFYPNVDITLTLTGIRQIKVHVSGEVLYPGSYDATPVNRVFDLIQMAGGLLPGGSVRNLSIRRQPEGEAENVDMERFLYNGDLGANPMLSEGMIVYVPQRRNTIHVRGAINGIARPDGKTNELDESPVHEAVLDFREGDRLSDAMLRTGGLTETADPRNARIIRHDTTASDSVIPVDLYGLLVMGDESLDLPLRKGDVIEIPGNEQVVYVTGPVAEPGPYRYQPGLTAREYVGLAGGPDDTGSHRGWKIINESGRQRRIDRNYAVRAGETIVVPERFLTTLGKIVMPLSAVSTIIISIIALQR